MMRITEKRVENHGEKSEASGRIRENQGEKSGESRRKEWRIRTQDSGLMTENWPFYREKLTIWNTFGSKSAPRPRTLDFRLRGPPPKTGDSTERK